MKLIDQFKLINQERCPNCNIGRTPDGLGIFWCKARRTDEIYPNNILYGGNELCTPEDWKVCPLNKSPGQPPSKS